MCEENFCKCPDGTILLHNECIELKGNVKCNQYILVIDSKQYIFV